MSVAPVCPLGLGGYGVTTGSMRPLIGMSANIEVRLCGCVSAPPDGLGDVADVDCPTQMAVARPRSASSDLLLADPGDGGVDVSDDRGLGEPVAKVSDRGEEDGAVEPLEVFAAVP